MIRKFPVSTSIGLIENQKDGTGEECLLSTCFKPYLPKDAVVIGGFQESLSCWLVVGFRCPAP